MLIVSKSDVVTTLPVRTRYVFESMSIGDSMHFQDYRRAESARVAAIQFSKRKAKDWRFGIRKMSDGWRVFRLQ